MDLRRRVTTLNKNDATMEQENLDVENLQKQLEVVRALCRSKELEIADLNAKVALYKEKLRSAQMEASSRSMEKESVYKYCIEQLCKAFERRCYD